MSECKPCFDKMTLLGVCLFVVAVVLVIMQCCSFSYLFKYKGVKDKYHNCFFLREDINTLSDNALIYNNVKAFFDFYYERKLIEMDRPYFETIMAYAGRNYSNPFCMMVLGRAYEKEREKSLFWYKKALENASGLNPDEQKYCESRITKLTRN